jgi:DnaJ family protein B protein 4
MEPMHVPLECTLEELYMGCTKTIKVDKVELNAATGLTTPVTDELVVQVKRGFHNGTEVTFESRGNQEPGTLPADIVFTVKELKHDQFVRQGANLLCTVPVTVLDTLVGCTVSVPTLDGRTLSIPINEIISPDYVKAVGGEGMPVARGANLELEHSFGDLVLSFSAVYPTKLADVQKEMLKTAFTVPSKLNPTQKEACGSLQTAFTFPYYEKPAPVKKKEEGEDE